MDSISMSHILICVCDIDESLAFYRDMLGMQVTFDGPTDPAEGGSCTTTNMHVRPARASV